MKLDNFKALWQAAIKIEEPKNHVGSDLMGLSGVINYGLGVWIKNPIKGTVLVPTMFLALAGTLSYMAITQVYRKVTDPNDAKANLKEFKNHEHMFSHLPQSHTDELVKRLQNMKLYNAGCNIETYFSNNQAKKYTSLAPELKNDQPEFYKFYKQYMNEYYFSRDLLKYLKKDYSKKNFQDAINNKLLETISKGDTSKFNFIFISLPFMRNSFLNNIKQKSLEIAIQNNNLSLIKNLIENPALINFDKLKHNSFQFDWGNIRKIVKENSLNHTINDEIKTYLSIHLTEKTGFTLFPKFKI